MSVEAEVGLIQIVLIIIGVILYAIYKFRQTTKLEMEAVEKSIHSINQIQGEKIQNRYQAITKLGRVLKHFHQIKKESLVVLFLDNFNVCSHAEVRFGDEYSVSFQPYEICRIANEKNSVKIVVAHNHPYNNPVPSDNDIYFAVKLFECAQREKIEILDNLAASMVSKWIKIYPEYATI